jgi:hypothetical protein
MVPSYFPRANHRLPPPLPLPLLLLPPLLFPSLSLPPPPLPVPRTKAR